jgi:opacity protein-like surface antigen
MKTLLFGSVAVVALITASQPAGAADLPRKAPTPEAAPAPVISPWELEFGARYWLNSGRYKKDLFDTTGALPISRLTYDKLTGHAAEGFWRLNHSNGVFLKGYFGGGSITGGHMNDEDFPPLTVPYSNTLQDQRRGSLLYLGADVGYSFLMGPNYQVGAFLGYHYWNERLNTFGCRQVAGGGICVAPGIPTTSDTLDNDARWHSLRVGLNAQLQIMPSIKLTTDVAYVRSYLSANDFHNMRMDIRGLAEDGVGNGFMIEAILSHYITPAFSVGLGGRWWHISTDGHSHFEQTAAGGQPQVLKVVQDRYGLLAQANYRFGETAPPAGVSNAPPRRHPFTWSGVYAGVNIGYARGVTDAVFTPVNADAAFLQTAGFVPLSHPLTPAGFVGGAQVGVNWQRDRTVVGIEADVDYAAISGSTGTSALFFGFPLLTTAEQNIRWLSTVRGRLGQLASPDMMVYITGGLAVGGITLAADVHDTFTALGFSCANAIVFSCASGSLSKTKAGWTAGAGIEYAITERVTFKGEYLYIDLGRATVRITDTNPFVINPVYDVTSKFDTHLVRAGLNFKLGATPVAAND